MAGLFDLPFEDDDAAERRQANVLPEDVTPADLPETSAPASAPSPARERRTVFTVADLTACIRERLEADFFEVWVEGEVSNCRIKNGLAYFTLKDAEAQLRVIMFRTAVRRLRFALEDGTHVVVRGRISVYDPRGEYQLVCEHAEPVGLGALQLAFEQLKKTLAAEGLFREERKRPLPMLPRRIGIVTSLDGAALRDIVRVLSQRHAKVHLVIRPARVQGDGAAADIARGLQALARVPDVDVIIVGRGGGSLEDLWAFNEEVVARAIAASPIPIISAIGHEVDWTIADFVADVRAATPSNAAELVVARSDEFCSRIDRAVERARAAVGRRIDARRSRLHLLASRRGLAAVPLRIASRARQVDELRAGLERALFQAVARRGKTLQALRRQLEGHDPITRIADLKARRTLADSRLKTAIGQAIGDLRASLGTTVAQLDALSPLAVLGRGYALCWADEGQTLVREASPALEGQQVAVTLARGQLLCDVRQAITPADAGDRSRRPASES